MIQTICRDQFLLQQKAAPAEPAHLPVLQDLRDTLTANKDRCVGMAANMIGKPLAIIVFYDGDVLVEMLNPEIIDRKEPCKAEEGCLSLDGTRPCRRWQKIRVRWQTRDFQTRVRTFTGWTAEIIQHECDHLCGILI